MPSGAIAETCSRAFATGTVTPVTGRAEVLGAVGVPADIPVTNISLVTSSVAISGASNQWVALVDAATLAVVAKSQDRTNTAWSANAVKTFTFSPAYTPSADSMLLVVFVAVATTMPTLRGGGTVGTITGIAPVLCGASTTGLTDPASLGGTLGAITASASVGYAWLT